jgi:hypothetical protein
MKTETLEMIIEELTNALSLERWRNEQKAEEIRRLKARIAELEKKENENV